MKQTTKTVLKKKPFITLSGKSTAGWAGLFVFSFAMIFYLGTLVGRGSIKVDLGQKKLSKESLSVHDYFKRSQNAAKAIARTYGFQLNYAEQSNNADPLPVSSPNSL